jgi:AcrR family transcriptional regulator
MPSTAPALDSPRVLRWLKPPLQARSRLALTSLLDAAEHLVGERGFEETSVQEIVVRSGTSVGSFYRRFKDKHGLLQALHERFCHEARATADDALDPSRWADIAAGQMISEIVLFLVEVFRERRGLFRAFLVSGATDPVVRAREVELTDYLSDRLADCLRGRDDEIRHANLPLASRTTLLIVVGVLSHATILGAEEFDIDDSAATAEIVLAACRYLGTEKEHDA